VKGRGGTILSIWVCGDGAGQGRELPGGGVGLADGELVEAGGEVVHDVTDAFAVVSLLLRKLVGGGVG
jgi:hypothetical protein